MVKNVDYIFHTAALKQVPSCEFYPMEAVKTNILGVNNLIDNAIDAMSKIICLIPIKLFINKCNGCVKSMMEKVITAKSRQSKNTKICITRYGNVMYTRGSIIVVCKTNFKKSVTVTDLSMTRFMMSMDDALDLVLFAFNKGKNGEIFEASPGATIKTIIEALKKYLKKSHDKNNWAKTWWKFHKTLMTKEELKKQKIIKIILK